MDITLESVNFNISKDLDERVREMFSGLSKYNDQIVGIDLYLKSHSETDTGEKEVDAKIFLPGKDLFISEKAGDFISAAQECHETAKQQLAKRKDMQKDRHQLRPDKQ